MKEITKILPDENAELLTYEEATNLIELDDYVWVELRHGKQNFELLEDETFYLRVGFINSFGLDLCAPTGALHYYFCDYNRTWRVWDRCPVWDNSELWRDERK